MLKEGQKELPDSGRDVLIKIKAEFSQEPRWLVGFGLDEEDKWYVYTMTNFSVKGIEFERELVPESLVLDWKEIN